MSDKPQCPLDDKMLSSLRNIVRGLEDEGDRVFFESTNDADDLREIVERLSDWEMRCEMGDEHD
jgi:hypothetical protein